MSKEIADPKDIFKNFDTENNEYILEDIRLKFRVLTVSEFEDFQDELDKMEELEGTELPGKQVRKLEREWHKKVLTTAFGEDVDIDLIKSKCTANRYQTLISEVVVFLLRFSGMEGLQDFIETLKANQASLKKKKD